MARIILLISFKKMVAILSGLVLILFMAGCGGGGGGGDEETPVQPLPGDSVIVAGTVDDGTSNSPIMRAKCAFVDLNGDNLGETTADNIGRFSINVLPDKEGYIRCTPPDIPKLILSTFLSTKGLSPEDKISGEDVTPTTTVVADIIDYENATIPLARKLELLNAIENEDPELSLLVKLSKKLCKAMLVERINVPIGSDRPGEGGAGGGGAGGDAGDGGDFSPIPNAVCDFAIDFAIDLEGEALFSAALEDLRDGELNRPDLAAIKGEVDPDFQDPQMRQDIKDAFDKWFAAGLGKPYREVADGNGSYFLPIPPNVQGFVRCTPPNQPQLKLATLVRKLQKDEKLGGQDVTPATTFFSHSIATKLSDDLSTVKENYLDDIAGLGDIHIITDGEMITKFELENTNVEDKDVGLVAFSATSLFNILYKNEIDVDYLAALDDLIDKKKVDADFLLTLGVPAAKTEEWTNVVNTSNEDAGQALGTNLESALSKARIRVKVTDRPGGTGILGAEVNITDAPSGVVCECDLPMTTDAAGEVILTLTGVPETEAIQIEVEASLVAGFEPAARTTQVVAFATVDLEIALTPEFLLQVSNSGTGGGTVTSSPAGINCGTDCTENYIDGTVVSLTATANAGSNFTGWSGDPDCADGQVTMDSAITCTAAFALIPPTQHTLQVTKTGTGSGTVTSSPAGISCGTDCVENYIEGTVVSLTATANAGSNFTGWSGDPDCADGQVTMDSAITCAAAFALIPPTQHTLQVTKTGTGSGTVTSSPAGISCGTDCTQDYIDGTVVSLTADPTGGSTFTGWSGDPDCSDGQVTMDSAITCTATFALIPPTQYTLQVTKSGTGGGAVNSSPPGISCGTDCTQDYTDGMVVSLTADPTGGSTFTGWSGGGCSTTNPCIVTMDQAHTVTADFTAPGPADLVIDSFVYSGNTANVPIGSTVGDLIGLTVRNIGMTDAGGFFVGFYISSDPVITIEDTLLPIGGRESVDSLAAGASITVPVYELAEIPTDVALGQAFLGVIIDDNFEISEVNETNNTDSLSVNITAPNIVPVFNFNANNQGWRMVGLYDDGDLTPVPDFFSDDPAGWTNVTRSGAIALGSGGFKTPPSPTRDTFLHWDFNSPDLSTDTQWQGISAFSYDITGDFLASSSVSQNVFVQAVLHVRKPDSTESFFTDFSFHEIPLEFGGWVTHTLDVTSLGMPAGTILLNVNLRIFFNASTGYDGFILVDNVIPN
jgi:hypothetical protein